MHFHAHGALVKTEQRFEQFEREVDLPCFFDELCVPDVLEKPAQVEEEGHGVLALPSRVRIVHPELPGGKVARFAVAAPYEVVLQAALPVFGLNAA